MGKCDGPWTVEGVQPAGDLRTCLCWSGQPECYITVNVYTRQHTVRRLSGYKPSAQVQLSSMFRDPENFDMPTALTSTNFDTTKRVSSAVIPSVIRLCSNRTDIALDIASLYHSAEAEPTCPAAWASKPQSLDRTVTKSLCSLHHGSK